MNRRLLYYPLKVWATTIILAPLLMILTDTAQHPNIKVVSIKAEVFSALIFIIWQMFMFGFYFVPSFIVYTFFYIKMEKSRISCSVIRVLLTLIGLTAILITMYTVMGKKAFETNDFFGFNFLKFQVVSLVIAGVLIKFKQPLNDMPMK